MEKTKNKKKLAVASHDRITVTIYVTAEMKARLTELSKNNGRSENKQVLTMINDWFAGNGCNSHVPLKNKSSQTI